MDSAKFQHYVLAFFLLIMLLAAYIPVLQAGYIWDDDVHVYANENLRTWAGLKKIWLKPTAGKVQYYPLTFTSFWLEYQCWQQNSQGYHLVNILLHGVNAMLIWLILRRLGLSPAWMVAIVFALHPVHVESVAWISERKNTLSLLFYLLSLYSYLKFYQERSRCSYALALVFYLFALLSKTVTCSLPVGLWIVIWWQKGKLTRRDLLTTLPFFLIGIPAGLLTFIVEKYSIGAVGQPWKFTSMQRIFMAGRIWWFYLGKLVYPQNLIFFYPKWDLALSELANYFLVIAAAATITAAWHFRARIGRGPLAALLWYSVTISPMLGFIDFYPMRYSFVADHFQYHSSIAILTLLVTGLDYCYLRYYRQRGKTRIAIALIVLLCLAKITNSQCRIYENGEMLWQDTIAKNPQAAFAYNNLGNIYRQRGNYQGALQLYRQALRREEDFRILNNIATIYLHFGRLEQAAAYLQRALAQNPNAHPVLYNNLGEVYRRQKQWGKCIPLYQKALQMDPDFKIAYENLAVAYENCNQIKKASEQYRRCLQRFPNYAQGFIEFGNFYTRNKSYLLAEENYRRAIAIDPRSFKAYNNLGVIYTFGHKYSQAIAMYRKTLAIKPDYYRAYAAIGNIYQRQQNYAAAIPYYQKALLISPDHASLHLALAICQKKVQARSAPKQPK